jgi:hypothetical protein
VAAPLINQKPFCVVLICFMIYAPFFNVFPFKTPDIVNLILIHPPSL